MEIVSFAADDGDFRGDDMLRSGMQRSSGMRESSRRCTRKDMGRCGNVTKTWAWGIESVWNVIRKGEVIFRSWTNRVEQGLCQYLERLFG